MTVARQTNLFAAEDWKIAYKVYNNVDFQAYDFDTMRLAMVEYIKTNFPENFNDYIESSEFIAIIELLAFLSQTLAFRMDVNSRENFLETAERRDSVFKLARMLGYNPKRNIPASGLLKVTNIKTTEALQDSLGNVLSNRVIYWDDENNSQSYEQFISIMNAAMSSANRFTAPIKSGSIGDVTTELYQLNSPAGSPVAYNFTLKINGTERNFNVCNTDFEDNSYFYERHPDPTNLFNMIYRNDTKGLSSPDTGFFLFFRQGSLQFRDYNYVTAQENRSQDVNVPNINESDVYLQEVNTIGAVVNKWTRVPNTVGQTLNYNTQSLSTRNLYSVENLGTDGIRLRFSDGNFANIPTGVFRLWHRVSDPVRYSITPQDARNVVISIPYQNAAGVKHTLTLTCSLQYTIRNSSPAESINAIKERAPQVYYTQNRMVSAQDYNVFPQSQSNNILKLKATNRTHAGHSRYIDINDPTGTYDNVDTFADDAYLYVDDDNTSQNIVVNNNVTPLEVVVSLLPNILRQQTINNFVYYGVRNIWQDPSQNGVLNAFSFSQTDRVTWNPLPAAGTSKTGYITELFTTGTINILVNNIAGKTETLKQNNFIKWVNPEDSSDYKWSRIVSVDNNGALVSALSTAVGPWKLSEEISAGWYATDVIVSLRKIFNTTETTTIQNQIINRNTFGLGYDLQDDAWYVISDEDITSDVKAGNYALDVNQRGANSWLVLMEYSPVDQFSYNYNVTVRGQDYIIQSINDMRFYNINDAKSVVDITGRSRKDIISFSTVNTKAGETEVFEWTGNRFTNNALSTSYYPIASTINLPLQTRTTTWKDITAEWVSNFGLLEPRAAPSQAATNNEYVTDARILLNTYFKTSNAEPNLVIKPNSGVISTLPDKITFPIDNATFGQKVVYDAAGSPYIAYRGLPLGAVPGQEVIYRADAGATLAYSYGTTGAAIDLNESTGRLLLDDWDIVTETGNITYYGLNNYALHSSRDKTAITSSDKLEIKYLNSKEKLDEPIEWQISSVFKEADGYVDPRKVKVAPLDSDNDLVPDRPLQFAEYVSQTDLICFEYFTDFDGFTYDQPVTGKILDYRNEDVLEINEGLDTITPARYSDVHTLSEVDWVIVKNYDVVETFVGKENAAGIIVYDISTDTAYKVTTSSNSVLGSKQTIILETNDVFVRRGRGKPQSTDASLSTDGIIRWQHFASNDMRIDPSISNVIDMIVLTQSYNDKVNEWKVNTAKEFPLEPTSDELNLEFAGLNTYKAASDTLMFRSAKFKLLFGAQADEVYKAKFRVVKLSDQLSDNELKTRIISAINSYFAVDNWEFGETFYFTELSTYIHQQLGSVLGSILIVPKNTSGKFGELFQVKAQPDELFINTATVNDIEIISRIDSETLKIR